MPRSCLLCLCLAYTAVGLVLPQALGQAQGEFFPSDTVPVLQGYRTSWIGNTHGLGVRGKGNWVQNQVFALHALPDGTLYANSPWDEGGRECGIYKDGQTIGQLADTHSHLAGYAITSDGQYVYAGIKSGFVRRYALDGKPAKFKGGKRDGSCLAVGGKLEGPLGLAVDQGELFVSTNAPDEIAVYSLATFTKLRSWPVEACRAIVLDKQARLWVATAGREDQAGKVVCFDRQGKRLADEIGDVKEPTALAIDKDGRLLVADNGPDQQVKIFDIAAEPKRVGALGVKGGVFAEPRGKMGADRFYGLTALACDAAGNTYVNSNGWSWSGTDLRAFGADGKLLWQLQGLVFVDNVDANPADTSEVYGVQERFKVDDSAPSGKGWTHEDYTLDPWTYPQDPRLGHKGNTVRMLNLQGRKFLAMSDMDGTKVVLFRFDGRIAVPAVMFQHASMNGKKGAYPPNAPKDNRLLWRDLNADGQFQADEFTSVDPRRDGIAGLFDGAGGYWSATWGEKIHYWPLKGLDANGVPVYDAQPAQTIPCPDDFVDMERLEYVAETDTMYISGYTRQWPKKDKHFIPAGTAIAAYGDWLKGNRKAKWVARLPYSLKPYAIPKAMSVAGEYVFVNYAGAEQIVVIRTSDGVVIGRMVPGSEIAGTHGDADVPWAVKAVRKSDGEYAVFVEDDRFAKIVLYLWKPPASTARALQR